MGLEGDNVLGPINLLFNLSGSVLSPVRQIENQFAYKCYHVPHLYGAGQFYKVH